MELVFASANKNKIRELNSIIPKDFKVIGLEEIGITTEIPEPGNTIEENAFLKANYVAKYLQGQKINKPVFADDSGLEVEALNNEPGVFSARYAGIPKNDKKNNEKLLEELQNEENRNAQFVTVICLIINRQVHYFEGRIDGTIGLDAAGDNGFGYDPLFTPNGYDFTFAQLTPEIKNKISHRAIAGTKFVEFLSKYGK